MSSEAAGRESGADRLVGVLEDLGVEVVFGLPGVHNLPIWEALVDSPIRLIGVRHEQTAVYAADGYNRATGKLGVALVTTGPGAANAAGAMGEALASGSAVLLIATDIPVALRREEIYRGVLHETRDQASIFASIAKRADSVTDAGAIGAATRAAAGEALAAPSGPVYLGIPTDLLRVSPVAEDTPSPSPSPAVDEIDSAEVARATELISVARSPLIWAGSGALKAEAGGEVAALAEAIGAPVVTTFGARGLLPPDHPLAAQGPVHSPAVGRLWDEADLVIAVGTDFDGMMTQNWSMPAPSAMVAINVDAVDASKNYPAAATVVGDARVAIGRIRERLQVPSPARPQAGLKEIAAAVAAEVEDDSPEAATMLAAFDEALPPESIVVTDMCIPGYWLAGYRQVPQPRKLAYPVGWGTLGFGFPASIGAAAAVGHGPAVCVCGDGGFLFACGELATIAQEELPLTVVIVDDGGYGMLRYDQEVAGSANFGVDLQTPDFVAMARSFGVDAERVDGFGPDFVGALKMAIDSRRPGVVVVESRLKPPPTTSPRWYRRAAKATDPAVNGPERPEGT